MTKGFEETDRHINMGKYSEDEDSDGEPIYRNHGDSRARLKSTRRPCT